MVMYGRDAEERRNFIRMEVDGELEITAAGATKAEHGVCKNLSASGLAFEFGRELAVGSVIQVRVKPGSPVTEPLDAVVEVIRCARNADGRYEVAGRMKR